MVSSVDVPASARVGKGRGWSGGGGGRGSPCRPFSTSQVTPFRFLITRG
jgi:hypothetical protein